MKDLFRVVVISVVFVTTNGKCPMSVENSLITNCEGSTEYGPAVYVDFHQINRPCTCIVVPLFDGGLLVSSREIGHSCPTRVKVQTNIVFGCPLQVFTAYTLNVQIDQTINIQAEYLSEYASGTFYHCVGIQQNGGRNGNLSVKCESPANPTTPRVSSTISTTTFESATSQLSHGVSSIGSSTSMVNSNKNADVTSSSNMTTASHYSLPMKTTHDTSDNMTYIIAGSAAGGALILVCLVVLIIVLMIRSRSGGNKNRSSEGDMAQTNEVFDNSTELPDNPLYLSSQPMDELGYSSDQEKQLGLPPTDSKTKKKINPDYDVPPNNKPIAYGTSSMPVYAVPKRSQNRTPEASTGDVYAEVCKPNKSTGKDPVRKRHEDGLLYMEVEQDTAVTKQTNTKDKHEITEGVCYAEIKHT